MVKPKLIILNGKPCSGKTHLIKKLSDDFKLPRLSRDEIKELLFDEMGVLDAEWSKKLGKTSFSLFFLSMEKLFQSQHSFLVDCNFTPSFHKQKLLKLIQTYEFDALEIYLEADPHILLQRFQDRWNSGERHRGHADHERFTEFSDKLKEDLPPLALNENIFKINTNNFNLIDYSGLKAFIFNS